MKKCLKKTDSRDRRILKTWAYSRKTYKKKIVDWIIVAAIEAYSARLATKNGHLLLFRENWKRDAAEIIISAMQATIYHNVRGFDDRWKAIQEAIIVGKTYDDYCREYVEKLFVDSYNLKIKKHLNKDDSKVFWNFVIETIGMEFSGAKNLATLGERPNQSPPVLVYDTSNGTRVPS